MRRRLETLRSWYAKCVAGAWTSPAGNAYLGLGSISLIAGVAFAWAAWTRSDAVVGVLAALCVAAGVVGAVAGIRNTMEQRDVRRAGTECEATVLGVASSPSRYVTTYTLTYRYEDAAGREHIGTVVTGSGTAAGLWRAGDTGRVRYDPSRPGVSAWIGRRST